MRTDGADVEKPFSGHSAITRDYDARGCSLKASLGLLKIRTLVGCTHMRPKVYLRPAARGGLCFQRLEDASDEDEKSGASN
jgi:hypothetical protein